MKQAFFTGSVLLSVAFAITSCGVKKEADATTVSQQSQSSTATSNKNVKEAQPNNKLVESGIRADR